MVIGIDIRVLGTGKRTGIEEYTERLLEHLLPLDEKIKYKLFYSSYSRPLTAYKWLSLPNVSLHEFRIPNRLLLYSARLAGYPKIDRLLGGADVFFSPHFFLASISKNVRHVITFHDLAYERFPEFFSLRQRLWHSLEMAPSKQANRADALIAVSDSTAKDLETLYGVDRSKIHSIHSGAPTPVEYNETALMRFRKENNLPTRYILSLGTLEPRKNLISVVDAFNLLKQDDRYRDVGLVLVGQTGWMLKSLERAIKNSPFFEDIQIIKKMHRDQRPLYYAAASVFVYPSFFEGFGFPPLEAMAYGTPVVSSFAASLPEVVGNAGILVDPYSISSITLAVQAVLSDENLKHRMVKYGRKRVQEFSWQKTAQDTLAVLKG